MHPHLSSPHISCGAPSLHDDCLLRHRSHWPSANRLPPRHLPFNNKNRWTAYQDTLRLAPGHPLPIKLLKPWMPKCSKIKSYRRSLHRVQHHYFRLRQCLRSTIRASQPPSPSNSKLSNSSKLNNRVDSRKPPTPSPAPDAGIQTATCKSWDATAYFTYDAVPFPS